jgi:cytochrome b561
MSAAVAPAFYSRSASLLHWVSVPAITGSVACVLYAQQLPKGPDKGAWMYRHKSLGLLSGMVLVPRLAVKLGSKAPGMLAGSSAVEGVLAKVSHYALYAFPAVMASTGVVMGLNGAGLPFFTTTLKVPAVKGQLPAKQAFWLHQNFGYYMK